MVRISDKAAAEPPSELGLRAGQRIQFRYLIRASAVKSANDAATAIGEAISGSEAAFARRMNRTAAALGMSRTTFKNAHGLTEEGHLSTARDMTTLGRHLFYDYPDYYNLFSRITTDAGIKEVANTNRRMLSSYRGADGIKTGYTRAAGFNLVASAERGSERIIATVFGGNSTATRNAKVAELLDLGFRKAPSQVAVRKPARPAYTPDDQTVSKTVRVVAAVATSIRPRIRPLPAAPAEAVLVAMQEEVDKTLSEIAVAEEAVAEVVEELVAEIEVAAAEATATVEAEADEAVAEEVIEVAATNRAEAADAEDVAEVSRVASATMIPAPPPRPVQLALVAPQQPLNAGPEVVTRLSTSGGRHWGINVGHYTSRHQAERVLLQTALVELSTLDQALRKVVERKGGYDANFVGLSEEQAALACRRLAARSLDCLPLGPEG
jgi:D-alanyl-D-alanine carboxypeptidase